MGKKRRLYKADLIGLLLGRIAPEQLGFVNVTPSGVIPEVTVWRKGVMEFVKNSRLPEQSWLRIDRFISDHYGFETEFWTSTGRVEFWIELYPQEPYVQGWDARMPAEFAAL